MRRGSKLFRRRITQALTQDHLIFVREEVNRCIKEGQPLEFIDQEAARIVKERYQE